MSKNIIPESVTNFFVERSQDDGDISPAILYSVLIGLPLVLVVFMLGSLAPILIIGVLGTLLLIGLFNTVDKLRHESDE